MSSSLTYTLTKLRSLPPASNRCFRRSGNCAVNLSSASSTRAASIVTDAWPPAYWRRAVGIEIDGMTFSPRKNREWGVGSGEWESMKLLIDSPLPIPHSPLPILSFYQIFNDHRVFIKLRAVFAHGPYARFLGLPVAHRYDQI